MPAPTNAQHRALHSNDVVGIFFQSLEEQQNKNMINELAIKAPSDKEAGENYGWLGNVPGMREWVGGRQIKSLREFSYFLKNIEYEMSLGIKINDHRFVKLGMIQSRIADLAMSAANHPLELLTTVVEAGTSTVCYDGQFFYDTDHSEGDSGSQSNDISEDISEQAIPQDAQGTTTDPSAQNMEKAILKAIQAILGFKSDTGKPINQTARKFVVHVPVAFWAATMAAVSNKTFANGQINTLVTAPNLEIGVYVDPLMTLTDAFAVHRVDGAMKPFVFQEAAPVGMQVLGEGSDHAVKQKEYLYALDGIYNVGYGLWQHSVYVTLT